jgi:CBS domain containing-hemolysin-like protein
MKKEINWIYKVFLLSFIFSVIFSGISTALVENLNTIALTIILIVVIGVGILFDMIGVAMLTSTEASLHARATKKIRGAKEAIGLLKNATKVSSICNDVIGDICGIVSGTLGAVLTLTIVDEFRLPNTITTMIITAIIGAATVGGKAIFKTVATNNADKIVFTVGKILSYFTFKKEK